MLLEFEYCCPNRWYLLSLWSVSPHFGTSIWYWLFPPWLCWLDLNFLRIKLIFRWISGSTRSDWKTPEGPHFPLRQAARKDSWERACWSTCCMGCAGFDAALSDWAYSGPWLGISHWSETHSPVFMDLFTSLIRRPFLRQFTHFIFHLQITFHALVLTIAGSTQACQIFPQVVFIGNKSHRKHAHLRICSPSVWTPPNE